MMLNVWEHALIYDYVQPIASIYMQIICALYIIYKYLHTVQVAKCTNVLMHISKRASWHRKTPPVQAAGNI